MNASCILLMITYIVPNPAHSIAKPTISICGVIQSIFCNYQPFLGYYYSHSPMLSTSSSFGLLCSIFSAS